MEKGKSIENSGNEKNLSLEIMARLCFIAFTLLGMPILESRLNESRLQRYIEEANQFELGTPQGDAQFYQYLGLTYNKELGRVKINPLDPKLLKIKIKGRDETYYAPRSPLQSSEVASTPPSYVLPREDGFDIAFFIFDEKGNLVEGLTVENFKVVQPDTEFY